MLNPNQWSKLVHQGRAKAIGVPWSDEEVKEIMSCPESERKDLIVKLRADEVVETSETEIVAEPIAESTIETPVKKTRTKKTKK